MNKIITLVKQNWFYPVGAIVGGFVGYLYWINIGCETGNCPITASPIRTILYGALMGGLLFSLFTNKKQKQE